MKKFIFVFAVISMFQAGLSFADEPASGSARVGETVSCCGETCSTPRTDARAGDAAAGSSSSTSSGSSGSGAR